MPRSPSLPSYRLHKPSGQAVVTVRTADGGRRDVYLGEYNSPDSRREYARIIAELAVSPVPGTPDANNPGQTITVDQVLLQFWKHAEGQYKDPDGETTSQLAEYVLTIRAVRALYGQSSVTQFGPLALKAVRQKMVDAGLARSEVNRRIALARRMFKWAAGEELIPFEVYHRLTAVTGLQKGKTIAPENEPIRPVDLEHVRAVLPYLNRHVRGIIEFMTLTGCRPGEACRLRRCDINTSESVWTYRPEFHKNSHRGKSRIVVIGPRAQELLHQFPTLAPSDYVFSPKRMTEEVRAQRLANRRTPKYPGNDSYNPVRRVKSPKRVPGNRYKTEVVDYAVSRAIERLNWSFIESAVEIELHIPRWAPNQIRHTHGTTVRRVFGLEAAQSVLGHEKANITEIYAEKNLALAVRVATEMG